MRVKRLVTRILIILLISKILFPLNFIDVVFATTDIFDINNASEYTLSNSNKIYIQGWNAKLKWNLAARWHIENGPSAMDWGTNVIVDWNYAYVTGYGTHAVTSIDITDPTNMSSAGYIGANGGVRLYGAYDLEKSGNYVYVASYIADSLEIIDATDPSNLQHHARVNKSSSIKLNGAKWIDIDGNYAYIASYADNALQIIDISNPGTPIAKGFLKHNTRLKNATSVSVSGNYAYVTSYGRDRIQVIDISDKNNPVFVAQVIDDLTTELDWAYDIEVVGNLLYVTAYIDDGIEILDISDPTNPTHTWSLDNSSPGVFLNGARQIKIVWNYAYVSSYLDDSLQIINISNPTAPSHVWVLDTNSFGRLDYASGLFIDGNDAYMTSYGRWTLQSIDITNPAAPVFQWELLSGPTRLGNPVGLLVEWNYAYIASYGSNSLEIMDISDSSNPTHVWALSDHSSNNELWWAWDIEKKWDYVYVSSYWDSWIEVVDVSDPINPVWVSRLTNGWGLLLNKPRGIHINGDYMYVVSYKGDSLQIFDISTASSPVGLWNYTHATRLDKANDVKVSGNYAYITSYGKDRITVLDISDKSNPVFVTEITDGAGLELNGAWDLDINGDYIYVASYIDDSLVIIDISNPLSLNYVWDIDDDASMRLNWPRGIVYDKWYVYISTYSDDSILTFDVSDPSDPIFIDEIRNSNLYDTSSKVTKSWNDLFFTQYLGSSFSIVRESYPNDSPSVIPNDFVSSNYFTSITENMGAYNDGDVTFQLSKDNGTTWYYYNGSSWVSTSSGTSQSNTITTINANIAWFNILTGTSQIKWKAFLNSNGTEKVELNQIDIEYGDNIAPLITSTNFSSGSLLPGWNHDIVFNYHDTHAWSTGVNTSSDSITLQKWTGAAWGADISVSGFNLGSKTITTTWATYPTNNLVYGKYKATFDISDIAGNTSLSQELVFYIDQPEFIVSTGSVDIWIIDDMSNNFSSELTITVKTVWAGFDVLLNKNTTLAYSSETISDWDGTAWFGYDQDIYTGNISLIALDENIGTQASSINTNWNLNTYTYKIKFGAIIDALEQAGWDYQWSVDFGIELDY